MNAKHLFTALLSALSLTTAIPAQAEYPEKSLRIIVPYPPGGAADSAARIIGDQLAQRLRQPVVVENRPGANGIIGAQAAASAQPDGYTLFMGSTDTLVLNPQLRPKLPYDPRKQFEPLLLISTTPGFLVARTGLNVKSGAELIVLSKQKPQQVSFASWGNGSAAHLGMLMLEKSAAIDLLHVPYAGTAIAVGQLLGGHVDLVFVTPQFALGAQAQGKVNIIGATSAKRLSIAPNVPTLAEQGFQGYDGDSWNGFVVPTGVPAAIKNRLEKDIREIVEIPSVRSGLIENGHELRIMSAAEFSQFIDVEYRRWGRLIADKKITLD